MARRSSSPLIDCRLAAGFTQESLAEAAGVDRSTVGRWERGAQQPQPWQRPELARVLGISLEHLDTLLRQSAYGAAGRDEPGAALGRPGAEVRRHVAPVEIATNTDHNRPGLAGVTEDAREASRFARRAGASIMSRSALDQVRLEVRSFAADYISQPLASLFADIRELRTEVVGLVETSRFPDQMRDLYLEACRLGGLQAHVCLDLGHYGAAQTHAQTAFLCAEMAGHNGMRAWVRGFQSLAAYWDGDLGEAVRFAQDGAQYGAAGSIAARLASLEARACAARGDKPGALAALARAEQARNLVGDDDGDVGVFTFPAAKQAVYAGTTLLAFGDRDTAARAARESSQALALYGAAPPAQRSSGDMLAARLDLGCAHLMQNDLDGLTDQLRVVLTVPEVKRTASIVKRAAGIAASLKAPPFSGSAQSRQIRAEIASFCAPPPALPPAQSPSRPA